MSKHGENTLRKQNARKTKLALYDATIELINEKGYENVSIADITRRANCGVGTFYGHFKSMKEVLEYSLERYDEVAEAAYEKTREIEDFDERFMQFFIEDYKGTEDFGKGTIRAMYATNLMHSRLEMNKSSRKVCIYIEEMVQCGIDSGRLSDQYTAAEYAEDIEVYLMGVDIDWSCSVNEMDIVEYTRRKIQRLLDGLLKR